jgi:hypothetical protein
MPSAFTQATGKIRPDAASGLGRIQIGERPWKPKKADVLTTDPIIQFPDPPPTAA